MLRDAGVEFSEHVYTWEEGGGTARSSRELGVPEHSVVKTLVFQDDRKQPFLVLMHGDLEVSSRGMARVLGVKSTGPCALADAERFTGYRVGGISPFATRRALPVYVERSVLDLDRLYINGGRRGFLVSLRPADLLRVLCATPVDVGVRPSPER
jgi:Cys-tRNA(Pro) deacylase